MKHYCVTETLYSVIEALYSATETLYGHWNTAVPLKHYSTTETL